MEFIRGGTTITAVVDIETEWPIDEMFGDLPTPGDRATLHTRFPEEFTESSWRLSCRCYVIRTRKSNVLVDAGSGPAESMFGEDVGHDGSLPDALARLDIAPTDIDHVVLTHHHSDHTGWCTSPTADGWRPYFPNAAYHLHPADFDYVRTRSGGPADRYMAELLTPLTDSGQLRLVADDHAITDEIEVRHAPGHTPGHRVVVCRAGDQRIVLVGDLLHLTHQVAQPSYPFVFDADPDLAAQSRAAVLDQISRDGALLGSAHLPMAFAEITGDRTLRPLH